MSRENLFSEFLTRWDTNQAMEPQVAGQRLDIADLETVNVDRF